MFTLQRRAEGQPQTGGVRARRRHTRIACPVRLMAGLAGLVLTGIGGCTFIEQTEDVLQGGPAQRIEAAKKHQQEAMDAQRTLRQQQKALADQQAAEERKLRDLRKRLDDQDARIAKARENQRITEHEEGEFRRRIAALDSEIRSLEFRIQAAGATGETLGDAGHEQRLQALKREAARIEEEISSLGE